MKLAGRRILVTGAASGIGRATAELFVGEGARIAALDVRDDELRRATASLAGASPILCDIALPAEVERAVFEAATTLGGLDGVVNSAGIDLVRPLDRTTVEEWDQVIAVNLTGPMLVCRAALAHLSAPATIVNIASAAGLRPLLDRTAYCAAKAGLIMFTKALALETANRGLRANVICPGVIDTPMLRKSWEDAADPGGAYREVLARNALGRVGAVDDISYAALYLSGPESGFVTGSTLVVDGGRAFH